MRIEISIMKNYGIPFCCSGWHSTNVLNHYHRSHHHYHQPPSQPPCTFLHLQSNDMQIITSSTIIDVTSTSIVISSTNIISVAILRQLSFSTPNIQLHRHHISFITDRKKNCCSAVNKAAELQNEFFYTDHFCPTKFTPRKSA